MAIEHRAKIKNPIIEHTLATAYSTARLLHQHKFSLATLPSNYGGLFYAFVVPGGEAVGLTVMVISAAAGITALKLEIGDLRLPSGNLWRILREVKQSGREHRATFWLWSKRSCKGYGRFGINQTKDQHR